MVDGILYVLATGVPWRDLPERFGPWKTVYDRFWRWSRSGFWDEILEDLQAEKHAEEEIDWDLFCIDGSVVRAHKSAAGARKKGSGRRPRRPRPGPLSRRIQHENQSDLRPQRSADDCRDHPRAGA